MGLDLDYIDGQTPLDEDEKEGLLIETIATRGELDEFEQHNIEQAVLWSLSRSFKPDAVFTEEFLKALHKRMYGNVWAWAGEFRKTEKNIGVKSYLIRLSFYPMGKYKVCIIKHFYLLTIFLMNTAILSPIPVFIVSIIKAKSWP